MHYHSISLIHIIFITYFLSHILGTILNSFVNMLIFKKNENSEETTSLKIKKKKSYSFLCHFLEWLLTNPISLSCRIHSYHHPILCFRGNAILQKWVHLFFLAFSSTTLLTCNITKLFIKKNYSDVLFYYFERLTFWVND